VLDEKVFVVHGGIGPRVTKLQVADINAEDRFQHSFGSGSTIEELLWAGEEELTQEYVILADLFFFINTNPYLYIQCK
jgi:hypothetical protein